MARPYGKRPKKSQSAPRTQKPKDGEAFKVRIRGKDDAPLTMQQLQQGLYEAAKALQPHNELRAKRATIYINLIDADGQIVTIDAKNEISVYPYRSAADEHGA